MPETSGSINHTWLVAIVLAVTALVYSPGLSGPFIYDDQDHIEINPKIHSPQSLSEVIFNGKRHRRILLNLSYGFNGWTSGLNPFGYKILNLCLHLLTVAFLYFYLRRVFVSGLMLWTPLVVFAIHPLQVESVSYIFGRVSLMSGLLTVLSLWILERSERYPFWKLFAVFVAALLVKESAVFLVFLWPLYFALRKMNSLSYLRSKTALASYTVSLFYVPLHVFVTGTSGWWNRVVGLDLYPAADYLINQLHYYFYTFVLFFVPGWQSIYHPFQEPDGLIYLGALAGLAGITFSLWSAWTRRHTHPLISFFVIFFFANLIITNGPLQMINPYAEYRLYLPMLPLALLFAAMTKWVFTKIPVSSVVQNVAVALTCVYFGVSCFWMSSVWGEGFRPYKRAAQIYPNSANNHTLAGIACENDEDMECALFHHKKALELISNSFKKHSRKATLRLAFLHTRMENYSEALATLELFPEDRVPENDPTYFQLKLNLLIYLKRQQDYKDLLEKVEPKYPKDTFQRQKKSARDLLGIQ